MEQPRHKEVLYTGTIWSGLSVFVYRIDYTKGNAFIVAINANCNIKSRLFQNIFRRPCIRMILQDRNDAMINATAINDPNMPNEVYTATFVTQFF